MKKRILLPFMFLIMSGLLSTMAYAAALSADAIVDRANKAAYYAGKDGMAEVHMVITDAQGRTRIRDFTILRKDIQEGGEQKFYVYFYKPEDVRDMVYMVWKHPGRDDDRWLYLPALDLVRRIAATDKRSSFVGSDFVYEDVSGRGIDEDVHTLVGQDKTYYIIKNVPKDKRFVEFDYYNVWIRKDNFIPVKGEYYSGGKKIKVIESSNIKTIQGYPTITLMKAENLESGGNTLITYKKIKYDINLSNSIFTERYLRKPPVRWIKRR